MASVVRLKQWTREEYDRLIVAGIFVADERVELLEGEIVVTFPQNPPHYTAIHLAAEALRDAFESGFTIRIQAPFNATTDSEPEPDLAVVPGRARDYARVHPGSAVLVVEVSDSTLERDRQRKARVYARAGVPEYWIVNLIDRQVEVFRGPRSDGEWEVALVFREGERVSPLAAPAFSIAISDLLP